MRPCLVRPVLALVSSGLLAAAAPGQFSDEDGPPPTLDETDPRYEPDPRDVPDPRASSDPREAAVRERTLAEGDVDELASSDAFEVLWEKDDLDGLAELMRERPWDVLPYVDAVCEEWLALVESGGDQTEDGRALADALKAKARRLAELADGALLDTRFVRYTESYFSWTPEERQRFREGQRLYVEAAKISRSAHEAGDTLAALTPAQRSLEHSRPLGDVWGQSMALTLIGRIEAANDQPEAAKATLAEAERVARTIRDVESVWAALTVRLRIALLFDQDLEAAFDVLDEQYRLSLEANDQESADRVLALMVNLSNIRETATLR